MSPDPDTAEITARGLRFRYRGAARPALDGVDLDLGRGACGLLLGRTGAGKSTLVRCLNGVIPRFFRGDLDGMLRVGGRVPAESGVTGMSRHVGVVFQDFETQIFSTSCLMEVAFGLENRGLASDEISRRSLDLLQRVGLDRFAERDPSTLSGGEKQRLVIAAVLALEAPLLVLDEPASDLDPGGRDRIYRCLGALGAGSVLLVEHDLEGLPLHGPATLLEQGRSRRLWEAAGVEEWIGTSDALEAAGVRAPPLARLVAALRARLGSGGKPASRFHIRKLDPDGVFESLREAGWELEVSRVAAPVRAPKGPEILRCERLTQVYEGTPTPRHALRETSLTLAEGEMVAIIGANGSGKTTLARQMAGLQRPTSGRVLYRGRDVSSMRARERARTIGFIFQNPDHQIFAPTVREEVAFGPYNIGVEPAERDRRVAFALEAVGLEGAAECDPFAMTKGERQRLALASVLACEPSLIIMDEPTTGLDRMEQGKVMDVLAELNRRGHTIVIITHALWLLHGPVGRALLMIEGRLAADAEPRELLADVPLLERAGLRAPDLGRLACRFGAPCLSIEEWTAALIPPRGGR